MTDFHEWAIRSDPNQITSPNVYWVSLSGNDANSGTSIQPFRTIQHGVTSAVTPAVVYVSTGRYEEVIHLDSTRSGVGILGVANGGDFARVGLAGQAASLSNTYFNDINLDGVWNDPIEGIWIDVNNDEEYTLGTDTIVENGFNVGRLDSPATQPTALTNLFMSDENLNGVPDADETAWLDIGSMVGTYDEGDDIVREGLSVTLSAVDAQNVFFDGIHLTGPNQALSLTNNLRLFAMDIGFDRAINHLVNNDDTEPTFISVLLSSRQVFLWRGDSTIELWDVEVRP